MYKNANPKRAGHIAVVVPSSKDIEKIKNEGPDTAQAGNINFSCNSLKKGFRNKKDAFKNNEIKFYGRVSILQLRLLKSYTFNKSTNNLIMNIQ